MASNVLDEETKQKIRNQLNSEKIKLWLPPYTTKEGQRGEIPQELINRYAGVLQYPVDTVACVLEDLRLHALEKLAVKKKFQETGIATLKVNLAGKLPTELSEDAKTQLKAVEIKLTATGLDLKTAISAKSGVEVVRLKLVAGGRVLEDDIALQAQNIKNQIQVMALCLGETEAEAKKEQERVARVAKTREAAELLSSKEDGGKDDEANYYLQIADQTGKPIDLPKEERRALVLAMTLHEKGRAAVKRRNFSEGLLLLLEADKEFQKCRADILTAVDNYALVCLDIVWCYLCLKSISDLPDAEKRLQTCDDCFKKSYGANLERLALVKGETGTIKSLFMRLHLLQGILAFHQHRRTESLFLINRAEQELKILQVDENQMIQVMEMGFSQQEARLGLRACEGNVQLAVAHIMKKREERTERLRKEKEEKRKKKLARTLGKTANGESVNVDHYENLLSMGYGKGAAAESLRQANNDILQAMQVLHDNPELLSLPDPEAGGFTVTDEMLSQVTAMGFEVDIAKAALNHFRGKIRETIEALLAKGGTVPQEWLDALAATTSERAPTTPKSQEEIEREKREQEAIDSIIPDIPEGEEDYLDLVLDDEAHFVQEYKALLRSLSA